jgi:dienelactone hydrolase
MVRAFRAAVVASLLCVPAACHHRDASTAPLRAVPAGPPLSITGDPESASGATWTLIGTLDGTPVDLRGILLKPRGRGPFPAVVLSHGAGGNAQSYGRRLGEVMRRWGLVCIAVNYTHARGAPLGAPGSKLQQGASQANAFRAHAAVTVLARLGYVDTSRVAAHGHSMGAFVTTAFVATYPTDVRVASHTSGGVLLDAIHRAGIPAPSVAQARRIQAPYQWHHALLDYAVPFLLARRFDSVLTAPHEGHLYRRLRHAEVAADPEVLARVRAWYAAHGMFQPNARGASKSGSIRTDRLDSASAPDAGAGLYGLSSQARVMSAGGPTGQAAWRHGPMEDDICAPRSRARLAADRPPRRMQPGRLADGAVALGAAGPRAALLAVAGHAGAGRRRRP